MTQATLPIELLALVRHFSFQSTAAIQKHLSEGGKPAQITLFPIILSLRTNGSLERNSEQVYRDLAHKEIPVTGVAVKPNGKVFVIIPINGRFSLLGFSTLRADKNREELSALMTEEA